MTTPTSPKPLLKATRGATQLPEHTPNAYRMAVTELLTELCHQNNITPEAIVAVWFTVTHDLTCDNPARIARTHLSGWDTVPMLCATEPDIDGFPNRCVRVLMQWHAPEGTKAQFVYLNGCKELRQR